MCYYKKYKKIFKRKETIVNVLNNLVILLKPKLGLKQFKHYYNKLI